MKSMKANLTAPVPTKTLPPATAKREPALTPWFDGSVKPARAGIYRRHFGHDIFAYSKWDGKQWRTGNYSLRCAAKEESVSVSQHLKWRGLASNPARKS